MSIRELDYGDVPKMLAEAREMQERGRYINGTVFHTLADEVDRLTASLATVTKERDELREALRRIAAMDVATGVEVRPEMKAVIQGEPARVTSPVDVRDIARSALSASLKPPATSTK